MCLIKLSKQMNNHTKRWERNRVEVKSMRTARRNSRIYKERLDGWTLEDIGFEHGITRERARQIVEGFYKKLDKY